MERITSLGAKSSAPLPASLSYGSVEAETAPPRPPTTLGPGEERPQSLGAMVEQAREVLSSIDLSGVNIDALLAKLASNSREDQQQSFLLAQSTIDFNRRMRDRIYQEVSRLNQEIAGLEQEVKQLQQQIEHAGFFEKIGEGLAAAFGGGKGHEAQRMSADLAISKAALDESKAGLEERSKLLEHDHQLMRDSVEELERVVGRIQKSIEQVRGAWSAEARALDAT